MDIADKNIQAEMHIIYLEESSGFNALSRMILRLIIRTLRIVVGCILLGLSLWSASGAWDILSVPFAGQSVIGIFKGLALGALFIWLLQLAFSCAFGAGPSRESEEERIRNLAIKRLGARLHMTNAHGHLDSTR